MARGTARQRGESLALKLNLMMMAQRQIAENFASLRKRWERFFFTRCRTGLPWYWPARPLCRQPMVEARRIVRQDFGRNHNPINRKLAQVLVTVAWPLAVLQNLWLVRQWFRPQSAFLKRAPGALCTAIRYNVLPSEYYEYQLWHPDRRTNIDNYLFDNEAARLFKVLNQASEANPLVDKLAFCELCKINGIPTPEILAAYAPGSTLIDFRSGSPPQRDLFVKARDGHVGLGVERLRWNRDLFQSNRGSRLRPEDLATYLANRARIEALTLLVQPALSNHPDLHSGPNEPLAAVRLVTGRSIQGQVTPIFSYILFGSPNEITSHDDWVTLVDIETGRLLPALQKSPVYQYRRFNSNGRLPAWDAAVRLATAAHNACFDFAFVGWDVAFTPDGPIILEGNANWTAGTYQALRGEPLGLTKFADVLATQLTRVAIQKTANS